MQEVTNKNKFETMQNQLHHVPSFHRQTTRLLTKPHLGPDDSIYITKNIGILHHWHHPNQLKEASVKCFLHDSLSILHPTRINMRRDMQLPYSYEETSITNWPRAVSKSNKKNKRHITTLNELTKPNFSFQISTI